MSRLNRPVCACASANTDTVGDDGSGQKTAPAMDADSQQRAESLLLDATRSHSIQVEPDEIQAVVADQQHGPELVQWALSHLGTDNLLTIDELAL